MSHQDRACKFIRRNALKEYDAILAALTKEFRLFEKELLGEQVVSHFAGWPGARIAEKFVAWQCEKCGLYHDNLFPDAGCDFCRGDKIAERMGLKP